MLQQSRLAFGAPPPLLPAELEPRQGDGLLRTTTSRMTRAGAAMGGFAVTTSRGLRAAASRAGRSITRSSRGADAGAGAAGAADASAGAAGAADASAGAANAEASDRSDQDAKGR